MACSTELSSKPGFADYLDHRFAPYVRALIVAYLSIAALLPLAQAEDSADARHRLVIQVSSDDAQSHDNALRNAVNLQNALGAGNIEIEIVAYGPGVTLMTEAGDKAMRITELISTGVRFSACGNTLRDLREASGTNFPLVVGVREVPAGVVRIIELQEQGYTYIRP